MGEKPTGRILFATGLLMASLLAGFASAEPAQLSLVVDQPPSSQQPWYDASHPLVLTPSLVNTGEAITFDINPSCMFVLNVYNATGVLLVDGSDACPDRTRGEDLASGETRVYDSVEWNMKDEQGMWLESGTYIVELLHTTLDLSYVTNAVIQTPVEVPTTLAYDVQLVQRTANSPVSVALVSLTNPMSEPVDLQALPACVLEWHVGEQAQLGSPCFGQTKSLMPGEVLLVDQVSIHNHELTTLTVNTPGNTFTHTTELQAAQAPLANLDASLTMEMTNNAEPLYSQGDAVANEAVLTTSSVGIQTLHFTSSCKAEMWVINDLGRIVYDSLAGKSCSDIDLEMSLSSEEPLAFTLAPWGFFEQDTCRVDPGVYTVVVEVPEFGLVTSQRIQYSDVQANACAGASSLSLSTTMDWVDDDTFQLSPSLWMDGEARYVRMNQPCTLELDFVNDDGESVHRFMTLCDAYDGRKVSLTPTANTLQFNTFGVDMVQNGADVLPEGMYSLNIRLLSSTPATTTVEMAWPADFTLEEPVNEQETVTPERFEITGTWTPLGTEEGTCHILNVGETSYLLSNARTLSSWQPLSTVEGIYEVQAAEPAPECSVFSAPSVEVVNVVLERSLEVETVDEAPLQVEELQEESAQATAVVSAVTVVVTASLLSILVMVTVTNEGLRLPATMAGLWFLGLIGKTHETTDGRYQRGRLMGYLTANPGCHFRALMSALDMSNGQITHHLRILESEENVWRKNDGRLVRYYPLTNQLNPSTDPDELPVPPLSPDPNSLQGKILNLLDQDGDLGQFPTQAELAKRLEKSQQLISHHLRTLQKYGLVERRKMGVKNRYKLTREAVFLLETSEDFAHR